MAIRALIVDDQEDVRLLIRTILDTSDPKITVAGEAVDGPSALAMIAEVDPEVVILDQMMPGLDGIDTAVLIRERRPGQRMIMCSAHLDDRLLRRAKEAGIADCIPKTQVGRIAETLRRAVRG